MNWGVMSPIIQFHLVAALLALAAGIAQLMMPKGTVVHRWLGRSWVAVIAAVSISSFWIQELNEGRYSWIHLISVFTLFSIVRGVWTIRQGDVRRHRLYMIGTFIGGLLVAGGFAVFGEDRILSQVFS